MTDVEFFIPTENNNITSRKPYPLPIHQKILLKDEIDRLRENNIISKSRSMFSAPCFIKKNDGTGRLLVDYRDLNKISHKMEYSFPDIHENFYKMNGMKVFSKLDLKKGFYQVKINEKDQHKTAFATCFGKFEFKRIPFGLVNAPKFFHNIIVEKLSDIKNITIFVDDILVFSKNNDDHIKTLHTLFNRLSENNILVNFDKTELMKSKITYLGFEISENVIKPDTKRITCLPPWNKPRTKRQIQKLLGEINWYRKFIPNLSSKLSHFYNMIKGKKHKISVSEDDMKIVHTIYNELREKSKLFIPDLNLPFEISSDASDKAIVAVLSQKGNVIEYFSKKYIECEERYTTVEKEMLSIFRAVNHWAKLIGGSKIIVHTDSRKNIFDKFDYNIRTIRRKAELSIFDITYNHVRGCDNTIADRLLD
ncbi:Retrovirus-related Pol polyprotein from transposon opus [Dictyocoela muelleri]|nr:Retrovirus-related Pol polyprotein from transposon opus [Dictyocoela muelleri]